MMLRIVFMIKIIVMADDCGILRKKMWNVYFYLTKKRESEKISFFLLPKREIFFKKKLNRMFNYIDSNQMDN